MHPSHVAIGVAFVAGFVGFAVIPRPSDVSPPSQTQAESPIVPAQTQAPDEQDSDHVVINGWKFNAAPLPESERRQIFVELLDAQESDSGGLEVYEQIAQKHNITKSLVQEIVGEGAIKNWSPQPK